MVLTRERESCRMLKMKMKLGNAVMGLLSQAALQSRCLTGAQIIDELNQDESHRRFQISSVLEQLISFRSVGMAEDEKGNFVYYPKQAEKALIEAGKLSPELHINVTAPDRDGGIMSSRVDQKSVSDEIWSKLVRGDQTTIIKMARGERK